MGKLPHKLLHILVSGSVVLCAGAATAQALGERRPPALNPGGSGRVFYDNPSQQLGSLGSDAPSAFASAPIAEPMAPPPANYADAPLMPVPDASYGTYSAAPIESSPVTAEEMMPPPPAMAPTPYYGDAPTGNEPMPLAAGQPPYQQDLVPMTQDAYASQQGYASADQYPSVDPMYDTAHAMPYEPAPSYQPAVAEPTMTPQEMGYDDPNAYIEAQESTYVPPAPMAGATYQDDYYAPQGDNYAMMEPAYQPEPSQSEMHYAPQQSVSPYRTLAPSRYEHRRTMERQMRYPRRFY